MLQRAASNAYSWWWASHIRTKQSKWLEQCLQDMEEKVRSMLKLLEEDGDSFVKRAEMYYKRRPELIATIEESFKSFRALADRYDLLSRELQNANHTVATVFPEQVQFEMSDDEDGPIAPDEIHEVRQSANAPQVPNAPKRRLKTIVHKGSKQLAKKKPDKPEVKSGLTEDEAVEEVKKSEKDILALQTVKEFVKSSYESGMDKYWGIENQIIDLQQRVSRLQDEFRMNTVIEDDEARALMAEAALKSCQETLSILQEKQEKSTSEAKEEKDRIKATSLRLQSLGQKYLPHGGGGGGGGGEEGKLETSSDGVDVADLLRESKGTEMLLEERISEGSLEWSSVENLTVTQLAEKIDQLVNKVISLETTVSTQTVLVNTLRTETDELNDQIRDLEEEKEHMIDDAKILGDRVKEMEWMLNKIQDLNEEVERQNNNLQTNFDEARSKLERLSGKLSSVKLDEENTPDNQEINCQKEIPSTDENEDVKEVHVNEIQVSDQPVTSQGGEANNNPVMEMNKKLKEEKTRVDEENCHSYGHVKGETEGKTKEDEEDEDLNWQQMLLSGMEDREKILLKEYTTILRNYKDVKKKLGDKEKTENDSQFDTALQIRDLKEEIRNRDEEIQYLKQELEKDAKKNNTKAQQRMSGNNREEEEENKGKDEIKLNSVDRPAPSVSKVEEKLRTDIDAILDENLDFWMRFSTEFHLIGKFENEVQDLQDEILKIKDKMKPDGSFTTQMKSDARPIYKHLREIQRELLVWLDRSGSLKDELKSRLSSLCLLQEDIMKALREGVEGEEICFSSHQAARFQGEVLNMKQENNKVREELKMGLELVHTLQRQIEKTLRNLSEEFGISTEQAKNTDKARIPLRSFIFGTKHEKKPKNSIFSRMHPNKSYQILRTGIRLSSQNH